MRIAHLQIWRMQERAVLLDGNAGIREVETLIPIWSVAE